MDACMLESITYASACTSFFSYTQWSLFALVLLSLTKDKQSKMQRRKIPKQMMYANPAQKQQTKYHALNIRRIRKEGKTHDYNMNDGDDHSLVKLNEMSYQKRSSCMRKVHRIIKLLMTEREHMMTA